MSDFPAALLFFPGLTGVKSWSVTWGTGIVPSIFVVECVPQEDLPTDPHTVLITYGDDVELEFPFCIIDQATVRRDAGGMVTSVTIKDRRWTWKFQESIDGRYNLRNQDGSVWEPSRKSPQDLASLLLEKMGEDEFDVSALPNDSSPKVEWAFANAAEELQRLVTSLGCLVVLSVEENVVNIVPKGEGEDLPDGGSRTITVGITSPEKPDNIVVVAAPTRYETAFQLGQAVGEEFDGSIVPITKLSYSPKDGNGNAIDWGFEDPIAGQFGNVTADPKWVGTGPYQFSTQLLANAHARELARKCIFKWYQATQTLSGFETAAGSWQIRNSAIEVSNLYQVLPWETARVENFVDTDGIERPKPAIVFGNFFDLSPDLQTINGYHQWPYGFEIDTTHGVVKLSRPALKLSAGASPPLSTPKLAVLVGHYVKDPETLVEDRQSFDAGVPSDSPDGVQELGVGDFIEHRHDLARTVVTKYDNNWVPNSADDNFDTVETELGFVYFAVLSRFISFPTLNVEYAGIIPIEVDGAIQQVTWKSGPGGAITIAGRNVEHAYDVMASEEIRRIKDHDWAMKHMGAIVTRQQLPPIKAPLQ